MYSTKLVNKNVVADNAYITIGDPYKDFRANPFRETKKGEKIPTPFQVKMVPKNAENGNFGKVEYSAGGYQECIKYINTQPLDTRKKGFGSKDAKRRDEFANAIRTEQYRSTISKESISAQKGSLALHDTLSKILADRASTTSLKATSAPESIYSERVAQYDIGRSRVTQFDPKSSKDTFYRFDSETDKRMGDYRPVSVDLGDGAWQVNYKPPTFGGRSETKNFFDKSHLVVKNF